MPVVAIVGAAIGAATIGAAGGALATGLTAIGMSATVAGTIAGAIGGAVGGAIGGGVGSVMQGGDFWDGAKSGALGGLVSGAFTGIGGFEGIQKAFGGTEAAASSLSTTSLSAAQPSALSLNPSGATLADTGTWGAAAEGLAGATPEVVPSGWDLASLGGESGSTLSGMGLSDMPLGEVVGSTPIGTGGSLGGTNLGSATSMTTANQVGNQVGMLGSLASKSPSDLGMAAMDYYDKARAANRTRESLAAVTSRQNAINDRIHNYGAGLLDTASQRSATLSDRLNTVFAKYGLK